MIPCVAAVEGCDATAGAMKLFSWYQNKCDFASLVCLHVLFLSALKTSAP